MRINEVIEGLMLGKKMRHSSWEKDSFLSLDKSDGEINFYRLEAIPFLIEANTLISSGWHRIGEEEKDLCFSEALLLLAQGERIKNDFDDDYEYIEMDLNNKSIMKRRISVNPFVIDHISLFSTEWSEIIC